MKLSVSLPTESEVESGLLLLLRAHHPRPMKTIEAYSGLAETMGVTNLQRWSTRTTASDRENAWENRVRWARFRLVHQGYLVHGAGSKRGCWQLTDAGLNRAMRLSEIKTDRLPSKESW
jgi:hypothetical protein